MALKNSRTSPKFTAKARRAVGEKTFLRAVSVAFVTFIKYSTTIASKCCEKLEYSFDEDSHGFELE